MRKSINALIVSMMMLAAGIAQADIQTISQLFVKQVQQAAEASRALNWTVGDTGSYNVNAGFIKGTMKMFVRERGADGIWVQQDLDLGFAGKQKVEILFDAETAEVKKILANGQEQSIPENDSEIVEVTQSKVTVPAGTFDCLYVILKNNEGSQSKAWVNPNIIPITGMIKNQSPSQLGEVMMELTSYKKQ